MPPPGILRAFSEKYGITGPLVVIPTGSFQLLIIVAESQVANTWGRAFLSAHRSPCPQGTPW